MNILLKPTLLPWSVGQETADGANLLLIGIVLYIVVGILAGVIDYFGEIGEELFRAMAPAVACLLAAIAGALTIMTICRILMLV